MSSSSYRITFVSEDRTIEIDSADIPFQRDGKAGSILDIALGHDIDLDHACGGVNACSTCHVLITQGFDTCPESEDAEEDMLDNAPGVGEFSRLACQAVPNGSADVVVQIPGWNRNHAQETH